MPTNIWPSIRSRCVRVTSLDSCGAPFVGPKSTAVSEGHISIKLSPQYEDGEETNQKNAGGKLIVVEKALDQLKYFNFEMVFAHVNPDIFNQVTGQPIVLDHAGNASGIRIGATVDANVAVETWTDVPNTACGPNGKSFGYALLPWIKGGRLGDFSFENALANFTLTGHTEANSQWGLGPYNVVLNEPVSPATQPAAGKLLTAIAADQHFHMEPTQVAPPAITAGAVPLAP
ncbi:hypothetical protein DEU38_103190 [Rhodococcus sp. AG1013]|uniref:hypothetical protein n=1 Tax=Rhodococcus sp. AG1013 TaxID=2183996 RepID=UPI000E0A0204|nr:hypothetical protein [Rhodococcus sp. AG1013]RDI32457.1 hypothetical protein DEU38_103190 [Rhodococcus sp. AG1013]